MPFRAQLTCFQLFHLGPAFWRVRGEKKEGKAGGRNGERKTKVLCLLKKKPFQLAVEMKYFLSESFQEERAHVHEQDLQ